MFDNRNVFYQKIQTGPRASDIIFCKIPKLALEPPTAVFKDETFLNFENYYPVRYRTRDDRQNY